MTIHYTDPDGRQIETTPDTDFDGHPVVTIRSRGEFATVPIRIPLDHVEEVIAGIRDTARQATQEQR
ncbi:hypothetical protein ACFXKI_09835 [Streptomyces mirabilis]|uniref:hypothetical protein n=1 Tax=Streptomyces mirabilis TaxID=68239 RepID=UPI00367D4241